MTLLGKILTFVNLVIAMAMVSWSVTLYSTRPAWFDAKPEGGFPPGKDPVNFAQLKEDIDALGRAATAAAPTGVPSAPDWKGWNNSATRLQGYAHAWIGPATASQTRRTRPASSSRSSIRAACST